MNKICKGCKKGIRKGCYNGCGEILRELPPAIGVSQWMNYGEKYHYDKFFKEKILQAIKDKMMKEKETITVVYYTNGLPNPDKSILLKENIGWNNCRSKMLEIIKHLEK